MSDDEILYHYTNNEAFSKITVSNTLRLTDVRQSNDSEEVTFFLRHCEDYSKRQSKKFKDLDDQKKVLHYRWVKERLSKHFNKVLDDIRVHACCFSGPNSRDRLSQWRGYASDGEGVAIGFSKRALEQALEKSGLGKNNLAAVKYLEGEFASEVEEQLDTIIECALRKDGSSKTPIYHLLTNSFLYKNKWFREEDEWRIYQTFDIGTDGSVDPVQFDAKKGRQVSYTELKFEDIYHAIQEIWLGPKNASNPDLLKLQLETKGYEHIKIEKSFGTYR